jgi:S-DNA-T family DNA segregation ATPase FtsK/SpoIIIE
VDPNRQSATDADIVAAAEIAYQRLVAAAAALDASLVEQRSHERELPERERSRHAQAVRQLREQRDRALREAVERRDARVGAAQARHARHAERMKEQRSEAIGKVEDLAETQLEEAQAQLERALWMAETIYDSGEHGPRERFERTRSSLNAAADAVRGALSGMDTLARRSAHGAAMRSAHAVPLEAAAPGAPNGTAWAEVARVAVEVAQSAHAELSNARLLRVARPPVLVAIVCVVAILGAGIGAAVGRSGSLDGIVPAFGSSGMAGAVAGAAIAGAAATGAAGLLWWGAGAVVRRCGARARGAWDSLDACMRDALGSAEATRRSEERAREAERDAAVAQAKGRWEPVIARITRRQAELAQQFEAKYGGVARQLDAQRDAEIAAAEAECAAAIEAARHSYESSGAEESSRHAATIERLASELRAMRQASADAWRAAQSQWISAVSECRAASDGAYPAWESPVWRAPALPQCGDTPPGALVGTVQVELSSIPGALPAGADLAWPAGGPAAYELPLCMALPERGSLLVETDLAGRTDGISVLHQAMLRLLTSLPPGKVQFLLIDPVGMGESFAGFMHLADESDAIIGGRIWSEPRHIEQRLADVSEHLETVIQKYLRDEFPSLDAYNRKAGEIAEPYRFVVMCDFPASMSEESSRRLSAISAGGARCGVHTLILRDVRQPESACGDLAMIRQRSLCLSRSGGGWSVQTPPLAGLPARPAAPPTGTSAIELVRRIGKRASESTRVEVPFSAIAPPDGAMWAESSGRKLSVPLGRAGATRLQRLVLGEGTRQHVLIAGRTGSGKSTLLHALITNLALHYSPDEVEMWLIDFKKGVEFRTYATHRLPHARVVAIESDREFGISVLQGLDAELRRRGDLFRTAGVQDLASYRAARPHDPLPRALLIIDEFQELFIEDDHVSQDASALLDRIVRQGRAFGMHAVLGSQTLGGAYTIARTTMGQMGVRIALQCNESDSQLILSDDNLAARLLARPGEAIYNDAGGLLEGNSPFQVVWLGDRERDQQLEAVTARAATLPRREPLVVFEGNVPALMDECLPLRKARERRGAQPSESLAPKVWLGEAVAIAEPTHITLQRRSGANAVVVAQDEEQAVAMGIAAIESIAAQCPSAELVLLDSTTPDQHTFAALERRAAAAGLPAKVVRASDVGEALSEVAATIAQRESSQRVTDHAILVMVHGVQRLRALRRSEDDYSFGSSDAPPSPDKVLAAIAREGPAHGVHVWMWADNGASLSRSVDRSALREFEWRLLFQCSAADSSALIDSGAASKLGRNRALLHDELSGRDEKFRPWSLDRGARPS